MPLAKNARPAAGQSPIVDNAMFANAAELKHITSSIAGAGLRSTASDTHNRVVDWIQAQLEDIPGLSITDDKFEIQRWQPLNAAPDGSRSLALSAALNVLHLNGAGKVVRVAGAVPYSLPTGEDGRSGPLVHLPQGTPITAENAAGRIVIRDIHSVSVPFVLLEQMSQYLTDDLASSMVDGYERPHLATDGMLAADLLAAGLAGAIGMVVAFDLPSEQITDYFDPHKGTHFTLPAVFLGAEEGAAVRQAALDGERAQISVFAEKDTAATRNLIATLPGQSEERIVLCSHTDGNTWVQENGSAGLLALAKYFAGLPIESRPRTFEFVFGTAHLHISREGLYRYAKQLDEDYDKGTVAAVIALEHLGTREVLPQERAEGQGLSLAFTGKGEPMAWFAGESPSLIQSSVAAIVRRGLDRVMVLRGQDMPDRNRVPSHLSFGGIGSHFHRQLIPTIALISGPWTLWAPSFGEAAIDFHRMRSQLLAVGDVALALGHATREEIAGRYLEERHLRAQGFPTFVDESPPEEAPQSDPLAGQLEQVQS